MRLTTKALAFSVVVALPLTACIDTDYDLDDIDTTTRLEVKDLVIPMNMDVITLGDIITIGDDSEIKTITLNGETFYAVNQEGEFHSDAIEIPSFSADAPYVAPSSISFKTPATKAAAASAGVSFNLQNPVNKEINFQATGIDAAILAVNDLGLKNFSIVLTFQNAAEMQGVDLELANIKIQLPKGLTTTSLPKTGSYDANTGVLTISSVTFVNGKAIVAIEASKLNLSANGSTLDVETHVLDFNTEINLEEASIVASLQPGATLMLPDKVDINLSYRLSDLDVETVSGKIQYKLEGNGLNISPVDLNNLPDFLAGDETNLILANPQIYLSLNNPVADQKLTYQSGIKLTPSRDGVDRQSVTLDNNVFSVGYSKGITGPYNFCLAKSIPANVPAEFANPELVAFSSLGMVAAGNGLPHKIAIELVNPEIPAQEVTDFALGTSLQPLEGSWRFLAPLALTNNGAEQSVIVYSDTKADWDNEDVRDITITKLELTVTADNNLPLGAILSAQPLDKNGNVIPGVEVKSSEIKANTQGQQVNVTMTGTVKGLDGVTFEARVLGGDGKALSPDQTLILKDIRAKVSGFYEKKF